MSEGKASCLNCGGEPAGRFCQDCGQKAAIVRLHPNGLARDFFSLLLDLETGLWRTFLGLLRRPGEVAREYVAGRRRRFLNPLNYLFFALAAYFLVATALDLRTSDMTSARLRVTDGQEQEQQEASQALVDVLDRHQRIWILAGIPVYAWVLGLCFRRRGFNFAEGCVPLLYCIAQTTLLVRLPILLWMGLTGQSLLVLALPLQVAYVSWATRRFYDTSWWPALLSVCIAVGVWIATVILLVVGCLVMALSLS